MNKIEKITLKKKKTIVKEIFWSSEIDNVNEIISLTEYIDVNSCTLRKKLLRVINDIENQNTTCIENFKIENEFNFWVLTNFREKNLYKNNKFYELTKIIAILEICNQQDFDEMIITINDKIYSDILLKIFSKKKLNISISRTKSFLNLFNNFTIEINSILKACKFLLSKFFLNKKKSKVDHDNNLFISFFTHINKKKFYENKYSSLFWQEIQNHTKINFLHLFIPNKISNNFNQINIKINKLEKNNETHGFLDAYINLGLIIKIFLKSLQIKYNFFLNKNKMKLNFNNCEIIEAIYFDLNQNFHFFNIVIKLYYFYLFKIFFKKNKFNSNCFYIYENQPWEKSLIYHWKKNNPHKIYGVINTAVRFWDLRFEKSKLPPDILLANGEDSFKKVINLGHLSSEVRVVESLRYKKINHIINQKKNNSILIIFDYSKKSNSYLLNLLNKTIKILDYDIIFKEHPLNKLTNIKTNFKYKKFEDFMERNSYDLVICTNATNASIDYVLAGHNVAVLKEPDDFNFSPLKDNSACKFFKDNKELTDILINLNYTYREEKKNTFFKIDQEYKEWKKIFNEKD